MNFAELRKQAGFKTQESLAKAVGTKQSTVAMWETNRRTPKNKTIKKLAVLFNTTIDTIFNCFK